VLMYAAVLLMLCVYEMGIHQLGLDIQQTLCSDRLPEVSSSPHPSAGWRSWSPRAWRRSWSRRAST
jgi:hypothetical protein